MHQLPDGQQLAIFHADVHQALVDARRSGIITTHSEEYRIAEDALSQFPDL